VRAAGKVIIVTGGGNGIGRALCHRFGREGAAAVVVADIDRAAADAVAREIAGDAHYVDVTRERDVAGLVAATIHKYRRIDLFCSNAGIAVHGTEQTPDEQWIDSWAVNVMAHVHAARAVLPHMLTHGGGYLLQTISAAGLLTHPYSATYAVTKHAALAFAEWLAIAYGDRGIKISALCPQGVRTGMLKRAQADIGDFLQEGAIEPEQVADAVVKGLEEENFLILPHPEVAEYVRRKATDVDRWLKGMRKSKGAKL
jgi:NAD(P)-dependent dehydrogenase (short-subunit alcohol dehydrogenase family)